MKEKLSKQEKTEKKDFNRMLNDSKDMPHIQEVNENSASRYGGNKMLIAPPLFYDEYMKKVPNGKLILVSQIREKLAKENKADFTCPLTAGIFVNIVAWASYQREENITPYWRCLKTDGELNEKYPGGIKAQIKKLEEEGFVIYSKGKTKLRYFVKDYDKYLMEI